MALLAKIGERTYEFETMLELTEARNIYARFTGSQNEFEDVLENEGIDFYVETEG